MTSIALIIVGVVVMTFATASIRYADQGVMSRTIMRILLLPKIGQHFLKYTEQPKLMRKSLFWRCDWYHFCDHLLTWGMAMLVLGFLMAGVSVVSIAAALLVPVYRGWALMYWLHVGLRPFEDNVYFWTPKQLLRHIIIYWKAP